MKKIILIVVAVLVTAGLVGFFIYRQQAGYTKVLTAKLAKLPGLDLDPQHRVN